MNDLEKAIYERLTGDATLVALLSHSTAVYYGRAEEGVNPPYIVFQKLADTPRYVLTRIAFEDFLFSVKAITLGPSAKVAGQIRERFNLLLQDYSLVVAGYSTMKVRRESAIDYPELGPGGQEYRHRGSVFRIQLTNS